jgi:hypothetical protein
MRIGEAQEEVNVTLAKGTEEIKKQKQEYKNIHEAHIQFKNQVEAQNSLHMDIHTKLKKQNDEFSLSSEIFSTLTSTISSFSRGIAESIVLGKSMSETFKNIARQLLIEIIAKTIERIALLTIEKFILGKLFDKENDRLATEKKITREKQKQLGIDLISMAVGGGGGSGINIGGSHAQGGAVSKGTPILVGEQGPELFVPNQTGQITQNARGTGTGGGTTVNFNINTVDASGFEELLVRSRGTITQLINNAVNERGQESLI